MCQHQPALCAQEGRDEDDKGDLALDLEDDDDEGVVKREAAAKAEARAQEAQDKHLETIRRKLKARRRALLCPAHSRES